MNKKVPIGGKPTSVTNFSSPLFHQLVYQCKKENCFPDKGLPATSHQFGEVRRGWIFHLNIFLLSAFECPRSIRWCADARGNHVYTDFFLMLSHSLLTGYCEMLTSPWRSIPPDLFLFSRKEGFLVGKHPKLR